MIEKTIGMLGQRVKDKVTGCEGVLTSVSFDLYGCVQGCVNPGKGSDGKLSDLYWFDMNRMEVLPGDKVMTAPKFAERASEPAEYDHGAESKPLPTQH